MRKQKYQIHITTKDRESIMAMLNKGEEKARTLRRCNLLLQSDEGQDNRVVARNLHISEATVVNIKRRYLDEGLAAAIHERPRPGAKHKLSPKDCARVTAIACSTPPDGHSRWTLRLLAEKVVELDIVDTISYMCISDLLKKTNYSLI